MFVSGQSALFFKKKTKTRKKQKLQKQTTYGHTWHAQAVVLAADGSSAAWCA